MKKERGYKVRKKISCFNKLLEATPSVKRSAYLDSIEWVTNEYRSRSRNTPCNKVMEECNIILYGIDVVVFDGLFVVFVTDSLLLFHPILSYPNTVVGCRCPCYFDFVTLSPPFLLMLRRRWRREATQKNRHFILNRYLYQCVCFEMRIFPCVIAAVTRLSVSIVGLCCSKSVLGYSLATRTSTVTGTNSTWRVIGTSESTESIRSVNGSFVRFSNKILQRTKDLDGRRDCWNVG